MTEQNALTFTAYNSSLILLLLSLTFIFTWTAYLHNYLTLVKYQGKAPLLIDLLSSFIIFLGIYFFSPFLIRDLYQIYPSIGQYQSLFIPLFQLSIYSVTILLLFIYALFQDRKMFLSIWKDTTYPKGTSLALDLKTALIFLAISLPLIVAVSEFTEILTNLLFGEVKIDQNAVAYLKIALKSTWGVFFSLISVLFLAPLIEEYLFRGLLQSYLRSFLGSKAAIGITSVCFALMHFSPQQAMTNIPLISSLFIFSLYLSFLYEKTRSLFATIFLHVTFNSLSVIRIVFTEA